MTIKGCNGARLLLAFSLFILQALYSYEETDTLRQGEKLKDGGHLVSAFGTFRLGFFDTDYGRTSRVLGIWYNNPDEQDTQYHYQYNRYWNEYQYKQYWNRQRRFMEYNNRVWVANWKSPLSDKNGLLSIASDGNLKISHGGAGDPIAVSSVQASGNNTSATLLENGNLVLSELNQDGSTKRVIWQSFDYPTDTLIPGMKIGKNLQTGQTWSLTTWDGILSLRLDLNGINQLLIWAKRDILWASGMWVEGRFNESVELSKLNFEYFSNLNERYFSYSVDQDGGSLSYPAIRIRSHDQFIYLEGIGRDDRKFVYCDVLNHEYSPGCVHEKYPDCRNYAPIEYSTYDLPFAVEVNNSQHLSYYECAKVCINNCSCVGFTYINGCKIRSKAEFEGLVTEKKRDVWRLWLILVVGLGGALLISSSCIVLWRIKYVALTTTQQVLKQLEVVRSTSVVLLRKYKEKGRRMVQSLTKTNSEQEILLNELGIDTMRHHWKGGRNNQEPQFFNFGSVVAATNDFSSENKLGEGGFGPVYKGKLLDGQEVAIKRLSMSSRQGLVEFKNEVKVIAKLQHNNLVRLVGCCVEKEEKILIYEYMPNKSLDFFLFDQSNQHKLDWKRRFNIVEGIAQGLLYLHKYSRLKIIHRDLKASNILLDKDMNPKISDFGMAKIFGSEESKANTNRVVGTYGYMPPEYAIEGIFSTKSDVFSFGVLMLEIVSGKRSNSFHPFNIIVYAWELWRTGRWVELIDPTIEEVHHKEVMRCIHVGLLCVQENPMERPNMLDVVSIIYNEASELPSPNQPAFYNRRTLPENDIAKYMQKCWSQNEVTITELEGR